MAERVTVSGAAAVLLMAVLLVPSVWGCNRGYYEQMINKFCLAKFQLDIGEIERPLWCSWPHTMEIYEGLTNCSYQVALRLECYWPNQVVDRFFMNVHQLYFHDCAPTGRLLHDPPVAILAPFIAVPVLVTLLMTALVVWRSKCTEGVL